VIPRPDRALLLTLWELISGARDVRAAGGSPGIVGRPRANHRSVRPFPAELGLVFPNPEKRPPSPRLPQPPPLLHRRGPRLQDAKSECFARFAAGSLQIGPLVARAQLDNPKWTGGRIPYPISDRGPADVVPRSEAELTACNVPFNLLVYGLRLTPTPTGSDRLAARGTGVPFDLHARKWQRKAQCN
jgi:hypothetical protein